MSANTIGNKSGGTFSIHTAKSETQIAWRANLWVNHLIGCWSLKYVYIYI